MPDEFAREEIAVLKKVARRYNAGRSSTVAAVKRRYSDVFGLAANERDMPVGFVFPKASVSTKNLTREQYNARIEKYSAGYKKTESAKLATLMGYYQDAINIGIERGVYAPETGAFLLELASSVEGLRAGIVQGHLEDTPQQQFRSAYGSP